MSQTQKSIAVLTSGGDAPGMNAAVRAVVRAGINKGMKVYGVYRGYNGLLNGDVEEMNLRSVSDIIGNGGTMLYTARSEEYATPAGIQRAADFCRSIGVSGVVVIGGDGSEVLVALQTPVLTVSVFPAQLITILPAPNTRLVLIQP